MKIIVKILSISRTLTNRWLKIKVLLELYIVFIEFVNSLLVDFLMDGILETRRKGHLTNHTLY